MNALSTVKIGQPQTVVSLETQDHAVLQKLMAFGIYLEVFGAGTTFPFLYHHSWENPRCLRSGNSAKYFCGIALSNL